MGRRSVSGGDAAREVGRLVTGLLGWVWGVALGRTGCHCVGTTREDGSGEGGEYYGTAQWSG